MTRTLFLTGGNGFLGRSVHRAAASAGLKVVSAPRVGGPKLVESQIAENSGPAVLLHAAWPDMRAAAAGAAGTRGTREEVWRSFVDWSVSLRGACAAAGVPFLGIGSGVEAYAVPGSGLEEPYLTYARRKAELREALESAHGPDFSWLRLHFLFGENEYFTRIVPCAILAALEGRELVSNSPERRRHWMHVDDAAAGLCAFAAAPKPGVWDITSNEAISYSELFGLAEEAAGKPLKLSFTNAKTADGDLKLVAPTNPAPLPEALGSTARLKARLVEYAQAIKAGPVRTAMTGARKVESCRLCRGPLGASVLSLGDQPLSNRFPKASESAILTPVFPLEVSLCETCGLPQLSHHIEPAEHFNDDYAYVSGASSTWVRHCRLYAEDVAAAHGLTDDDFILEVGSNDGALLKAFSALGVRGVGVEPSGIVADLARKAGMETIEAFFDAEFAERFKATHGRPKALIGNNLLALMPDTHGFLCTARDLIADDGFLCFEFPHFTSILRNRRFDTIYHEHYVYLGLGPLLKWADANDMHVYAVEPQTIHGGSLRVFMRRGAGGPLPASVKAILGEEKVLAGAGAWKSLDTWLRDWRGQFRTHIAELRQAGRVVAGYAAASKATVTCNYLGLTKAELPFCCDASPLKQGRTIPGTGIPIISPEKLKEQAPDVVIVFAWNIFEEIARALDDLAPGASTIVRHVSEAEELAPLASWGK